MCRSRDLIGNCIGAERGDYTWNGKRFCDLHVDSIRSLLVSLNAIKRTQLLTEHNNNQNEECAAGIEIKRCLPQKWKHYASNALTA